MNVKKSLPILIVIFFFFVASLQSSSIATSANTSMIFYVGGSGAGNFSTIQEAIIQANHSDRIMVYPGTYNESITVFKSLHIKSIVPHQAFIHSPEKKDTILISSDRCILEGFNVSGQGQTSLTVTSNHNVIRNNIFFKNPGRGLDLYRSKNNSIEHNTFFSNGIRLSGSISEWTSHRITNNTVDDKPILYVTNRVNLSILSESLGQLILANCTACIVKNCSIGGGDIGILLGHSSFCVLKNNSISQSTYAIYLTHSTNSTISFNSLSNNQYGLSILHGTHNKIRNNNFENNTKIGCEICCSSRENKIYHNIFINNNQSALDQFSNQWFSNNKGNYWSDYTGVDENNSGIGDSSYEIAGGTAVDPFPLMHPSFPVVEKDTTHHESPFTSFILVILCIFLALFLKKKIGSN